MQSKQLVKVFSRIFGAKEEEMVDDLSEGDVAETIGKFYEQSRVVTPPKKSTLGLHQVPPSGETCDGGCLNFSQVDKFLEELSGSRSKEEDQQHLLARVTR